VRFEHGPADDADLAVEPFEAIERTLHVVEPEPDAPPRTRRRVRPAL
jgi:hypothetical protein